MPLIPSPALHCDRQMRIREAKLVCDICQDREERDVPADDRDWKECCDEYMTLVRDVECQKCPHQETERFPHGRAPLSYLPGSYDKRVFIGGNYDFMPQIRAVKLAVLGLNAGFHPILPYDDFQIPPGQIYDWDLRLLHNCKYAIFEVTTPGGELFEIARCSEYKANTLLVYQARGRVAKPPKAQTMLLESGEHEHRSYRRPEHLPEIVGEFLQRKDPAEWRKAVGVAGFHFERYVVRHKLYSDGRADHEYSYIGLQIDIPDFRLSQLTHELGFTAGRFTSKLQLEGPPRVKWKGDPTRSSNRAKVGVVSFEPPLGLEDRVSYTFRASTQGAYISSRKDLRKIPRDARNDPFLAAGLEFNSREIPFPVGIFILSTEFPEKYPVRPQPAAYFGTERRNDGIRMPPDEFTFTNNVATLSVSQPRLSYRYCIVWEVPEELPEANTTSRLGA